MLHPKCKAQIMKPNSWILSSQPTKILVMTFGFRTFSFLSESYYFDHVQLKSSNTFFSLEHSLTFTDGSDWEVNAGQSRFDKTVSGRSVRLCFWDNKKIGKLKSTGKTEQTPAYTFLRTHSLLLRRTKKNILRYSDENWINLLKTRFQAGFTL